jgi:hypothetical protein
MPVSGATGGSISVKSTLIAVYKNYPVEKIQGEIPGEK